MTSQNLFTSSFKAKHYLLVVFASMVLFIMILAIISIAGMRYNWVSMTNFHVLSYEKLKVENLDGEEILFLGDSSLGNAIDAKLFTEISNKKSINLSLSGSFGFAAPLNLLRRAIEKTQVKTVVLFYHGAHMTTGPAYMQYLQSVYSFTNDFAEYSIREVARLLFNPQMLSNIAQWWWRRAKGEKVYEIDFSHDYVPQLQRMNAEKTFKKYVDMPIAVEDFKPEKLFYLKRIAKLCKDENLRCIHVHGPIIKPRCDNSKPYFNLEHSKLKAEDGLTVITDLVCMPKSDLGDTIAHIHPGVKDKYTRIYYEKLKPFIR
ncbi:MAG: hypothetical protein HQL69_04480 [Magnetococcales bacterium]|nr:hypothetical protein [Magnetococcales bacterium]